MRGGSNNKSSSQQTQARRTARQLARMAARHLTATAVDAAVSTVEAAEREQIAQKPFRYS